MEFSGILQAFETGGGIKWALNLEERIKNPKCLERYGYKVYSQNDEDGIINEIFRRIGTKTKTFIEFGVDIGLESNTHALLLQGWKGLWIEGRAEAYSQIQRRFAPALRQGQLTIQNAIVTKSNINQIISDYSNGDLDLLSIDIDGNDYHIWKVITDTCPRVVIIEYNGKLSPEIDWKMPYNEVHTWDLTDRVGASLKALEQLGRDKGYQLVGTNVNGVNAFFVRKDLAKDLFLEPATAENLYNPARHRGYMSIGSGHRSMNYIGSDREGIEGVFEYYPDWNSLISYGFWPTQVDGSVRYNLMSHKEAGMFIRFIPDCARAVRIQYSINVPLKSFKTEIEVRILFDGKEHTFSIKTEAGFLEVPVLMSHKPEDIVPLIIRTESLWIPDKIIHNNDNRKQGLSINEIKYVTNGKADGD